MLTHLRATAAPRRAPLSLLLNPPEPRAALLEVLGAIEDEDHIPEPNFWRVRVEWSMDAPSGSARPRLRGSDNGLPRSSVDLEAEDSLRPRDTRPGQSVHRGARLCPGFLR